MSCLINRNNEGLITGVKTPTGEDSQLFKDIHSNIFMGDAESSINILMAAYTPTIEETTIKYETGEPKLFLKSSKGNEFDNITDMLIADEIGSSTIGFKNSETQEFIPIAKFNTHSSEKNTFLSEQVQQGILSSERILHENGETYFQGKGLFPEVRKVMAKAAKFEALVELGIGRTKAFNDGRFQIEFPTNTTVVESKDGNKMIDIKEIPAILNDKSVTNKPQLAALYDSLSKEEKVKSEQKVNSAPILTSLYSFLKSMGFTVTSLEEYRKNYNTKYGKDPDILAISDMANKVVALANGVDVSQELTEEVAHIAIESYAEQSSIAGALALVHLTPEYTQYADYYREKYSPFTKDETELEDKIRKEILGKVLARQIKEKFNKANKTAEELSLIGKLESLFRNFIEYIQSVFRPHHGQALNRILNEIADMVVREDMGAFDKAFESDNFFYSAMPAEHKKIENNLKSAKQALEELFIRKLQESTPKQAELDRIVDDMTDTEIMSSINTIVGIAKTQASVLEASIKTSLDGSTPINEKDGRRYSSLKSDIIPILTSIQVNLNEKIKPGSEQFQGKTLKIAQETVKTISEVSDKVRLLQPQMDIYREELVANITNETLNQTSLTDAQKDKYKAEVEGNIKDTTWLGKLFSPISSSRNIILQLIYNEAVKMSVIVNNQLKSKVDPMVKEIYDKKYESKQKELIKRKDGKKTGFFLTFINWGEYYNTINKTIKIESIVEVTGKTTEEVEKLLTQRTPEEIIKDQTKILQFRELIKEKKKVESESRFKEEYEIEKEAKYERAGIAKDSPTRVVIDNKNRSMMSRNKKYIINGKMDKTNQSEADKLEDIADIQAHQQTKSPLDQFGNVLDGLKIAKIDELTQEEINALPYTLSSDYKGEIVLLDEKFTKDMLEDDALVSLELNDFTMAYISDIKENGVNKASEDFIAEVKRLEDISPEAAYNFVVANSSFGISSEYYESLGASLDFMQVAQDFIKKIPVKGDQNKKQTIYNDLKSLQRSRKGLLKQYKKIKNPTETDVINMMGTTQAKIRELDEDIAQKRIDLALPSEYYDKISFSGKSVRTLSEDFYKLQEQSPLSMYEFCMNHMTESNKDKVQDFKRDINDYVLRGRPTVKKKFAEFIAEIERSKVLEGIKNPTDKLEFLKEAYAKQNVASYFQKNSPQGFNEALEAIKSGEIKLSTILTDKASLTEEYSGLKFLDINPDFVWTTAISDNQLTNSRFKADGFRDQPNIDKYFDTEMTEKFGITKEQFLEKGDDLNLYTPTKNKEAYELLKILMDMRAGANQSLGGVNDYNKWQMVQMSETTAERVQSLFSKNAGKTIKASYTDMIESRVDENEYGTVIFENVDTDVKIIPKYFQAPLEEVSDVTESLIMAEILNLKEALMYEARTIAESDINALLWKVSNQKFRNNGGSLKKQRILKTNQVSNFHEQAKEYVDHKLYGIKQSRHMETEIFGKRVDMTQVVNAFQGFVRFKNLAFNPLVDLTSATTGIINNVVNQVTQQYYSRSSGSRGRKLAGKLMGSYIAESGKVDKTSKLNHWLEFFQVENIEGRIKDTKYGRGIRMIFKSDYAGSKLANMPVTPEVLMSIVSDFRNVDGKFMSYTDFFNLKRNESKENTSSEIGSMWDSYKKEAFYDYVIVDEKGIRYNQKFEDLFNSKDAARSEFEKLQIRIVQKSKMVIQNVDGMLSAEDQVMAQRDVLTNTVMVHKGWLVIMLTRGWRRSHLNLSTGQVEEGHYITLMKFLSDITTSKKDGKKLRELYDSLDPMQKRNMFKVALETGISASLLALGAVLFAEGDDDDKEDETYLGNLAKLIYLRTVSEFNSVQITSMHGSIIDTLKSPIVAMTSVEAMAKTPGKVIDSITGKKDDSTSTFLQHLVKQTIAKRYFQVGSTANLNEQIKSYRHFNDLTLWNLSN